MKRLLLILALLRGFTAVAPAPAQTSSGTPAPVTKLDPAAIDPALRKYLIEPPHVTCITQDYLAQFEYARYLNKCPDPYHVTIVFGNIDDVLQLDLAPGEARTSHLNIQDYLNRKGSSWYICPRGYSAVDAKGQYFKRPISSYLCRVLGS